MQKGEFKYYLGMKIFDIYRNDADVLSEIIDNMQLKEDTVSGLLRKKLDKEIIEKLLHRMEGQTKDKNIINVYKEIIRACHDEEVYQKILRQTDDIDVVNFMCYYCKSFSEEFLKKILNQPNLSCDGLSELLEYFPEISLDDKLIDKVIKNSQSAKESESYVEEVMLHVLKQKNDEKTAEKLLRYLIEIKDSFDSSNAMKILAKIVQNNSSDAVIKTLMAVAKTKENSAVIFDLILREKASLSVLSEISQYYYVVHQNKMKQEEKSDADEVKPKRRINKSQDALFGFYKDICERWKAAVKSTNDLAVLDYIWNCHEKLCEQLGDRKKDFKEIYKPTVKECFEDSDYMALKLKQMFPHLPTDQAMNRAFNDLSLVGDRKEKSEQFFELLKNIGNKFLIEYLEKYSETTDPKLLDEILKNKERMMFELPNKEENERRKEYKKLVAIEMALHNNNYIESCLRKKYPDLTFEEALIREAARVVKSGDAAEKERFNNFLLAEGEAVLLNNIDERVCTYLVDNFSQQNLDDVNALRSFYGLKIIIDETKFADSDIRTVRRMQFDDSVNMPDKTSEFYPVQHSEAYRNFRRDGRRRFKPSDYYDMLDNSEAVQVLKDFGYEYFVYQLPDVLAEAKVPPEIAVQFNVKDLQAVFCDQLLGDEKEVSDRYGELLFVKKRAKMSADEDKDDLPGAREQYWVDMVNNKRLVALIKDDLRRHNISEEDIKLLFASAEVAGYPNSGRKYSRVSSVFFQLHHILGLKDGGKNYPSNFAPVVFYPSDVWTGVGDSFSSHTPLHRYDTPLDKFYVVEDAERPTDIMLTRARPYMGTKAVRIRTIFADDENNSNSKVLYYGGARRSSRYVGRLHDMVNIEMKAKKLAKKQKSDEERMKGLVQIVFQNVLNRIEQSRKNEEKRKMAEKREKIEARKEALRKRAKKSTERKIKSKKERE